VVVARSRSLHVIRETRRGPEFNGFFPRQRAVDIRYLAPDYAHRPAVQHEMMIADDDVELIRAGLRDCDSQQRSLRDVETFQAICFNKFSQALFLFTRADLLPVKKRERRLSAVMHDLARVVVRPMK